MEEQVAEVVQSIFANQPKLFGKWDYTNIKIEDPCFKDYISITSTKS
jgi:small subunit ribosomal protein S5e